MERTRSGFTIILNLEMYSMARFLSYHLFGIILVIFCVLTIPWLLEDQVEICIGIWKSQNMIIIFLYDGDMDAGGISHLFCMGRKPPNATSFQDNKIDKLEEVFRDVRFQSAFSKDGTMIIRTCRSLVGFWQALAR